ncbi:unnamed protein product [Paramecium octaurelia]|uniref:Transmembrane protein n=1 Tax=Paramecium octaurelia TaxID=43137 RepID=A0A8S1UW99_PAROT|nr:unnamed protein product [Paramecium octaurelia]
MRQNMLNLFLAFFHIVLNVIKTQIQHSIIDVFVNQGISLISFLNNLEFAILLAQNAQLKLNVQFVNQSLDILIMTHQNVYARMVL